MDDRTQIRYTLDEPSVDIGKRDPDYPYRSALPWRNERGIENYTICCPRCGSYKLSRIERITLSEDNQAVTMHFWCGACKRHGGIGFFPTRHGMMLATD